MDIGFIRDLLISILFGLLIILIIGGGIGGYILYRRINQRVQSTVETVERPVRFAEKILAYARGGSKGFVESFSILFGRGGKHEHQPNGH